MAFIQMRSQRAAVGAAALALPQQQYVHQTHFHACLRGRISIIGPVGFVPVLLQMMRCVTPGGRASGRCTCCHNKCGCCQLLVHKRVGCWLDADAQLHPCNSWRTSAVQVRA
jgi:hypothetical protein